MTPSEARTLANDYLTASRGEACAVFEWSASEARTHWRFYWNTIAAIEGREVALKGVSPVAVDKRSGGVQLDPKLPARSPVNALFPSPPPGRVESWKDAADVAQAWLDATTEKWCTITEGRELAYGWAFSSSSDDYLRTRDVKHALVGIGALVVVRETGQLYALGSALPFEALCAEFARDVLGK